MTASEDAMAFVPGPGGFATAVQPRPLHIPDFPVPRASAGLRLHGEYQGSGFAEPRYIARRGDGQVVQLSRLLYLVAEAADGIRDTEAISRRVSDSFGRDLSENNISFLIDEKLIPLGIVVPWGQHGDEVAAPRSDLLLALKGHKVLFDERQAGEIGRGLAWLHRPLVVALVLLGAVAMDVWLFGFHGAITPVLAVLDQPVLMIVVFALTVVSLVFHEFGHASACRYGGACPGCIGFGIFLVWPSMYTDVTDVYRIGRGGRIRTDLGGVYFNVVFMLLLLGCYAVTGQTFLLSAIYLGHFEVLEQLMPAVRLDGYYILGDLAGVPDLYGKIRPILRSMIPGRPTPPEVADLKPSARLIVTAWVVSMVPLLLADLGYALWNLPRLLSTGARSLTEQLSGTFEAFAHGHLAAALAGVIGSAMLIIPLVGMVYLSVRMAGRLLRAARRATRHSRRSRVTLATAAITVIGALCFAWAVGLTPKPLPPQPPLVPALQPGVPTAAATPVATPTSSASAWAPANESTARSSAPHSDGDGDDSQANANGGRRTPKAAVARPSAAAPTSQRSQTPTTTPAPAPTPTPTLVTATGTPRTGSPTASPPTPNPTPSATRDPSPGHSVTASTPASSARPGHRPGPHRPGAPAGPGWKFGPAEPPIQFQHLKLHLRSDKP